MQNTVRYAATHLAIFCDDLMWKSIFVGFIGFRDYLFRVYLKKIWASSKRDFINFEVGARFRKKISIQRNWKGSKKCRISSLISTFLWARIIKKIVFCFLISCLNSHSNIRIYINSATKGYPGYVDIQYQNTHWFGSACKRLVCSYVQWDWKLVDKENLLKLLYQAPSHQTWINTYRWIT